MEIANMRPDFARMRERMAAIRTEIGNLIVGQDQTLDLLMAALVVQGHVLIEGVPGIAKTLAAKSLARAVSGKYSRIQFTPDLMPADVTGTSVFNQQKGAFEFKAGPVFGNLILTDEINRAPAKTQSALFEAMEEQQVTVDGHSYKLEAPFVVFATQNPIDQEGTYRLPEAQLDRFLFKIIMTYPGIDEETEILKRYTDQTVTQKLERINAVLSTAELNNFHDALFDVRVEEHLYTYIAKVIRETRQHHALYLGASPRAGLAILNASKARAAMDGRDFITPDDIRFMAFPALRHRLLLTAEKEMEEMSTDDVITEIFNRVEVPR